MSSLKCDLWVSAWKRSSWSSPATMPAPQRKWRLEAPMRNTWIIAKREYNHYFISPIAYVVAFMILLTVGIIFAINIYFFVQNAFQSFGQVPDISPITGAFGFLLVLSIPAITMRLLADEARMGTLELLLTAPVRDFELVAGKWLGGFLFILTILAVTLVDRKSTRL